MKKKSKNIGINVPFPRKKCSGDKHCPFHGENIPRGRVFEGKVIRDSMHRTVVVEWPRIVYIPKYERYLKKRTRVKAHNPECIDAKVGDTVIIAECRPISKTKNFVVVHKKK